MAPSRRLDLRDGTTHSADWYVLAVPFDRVADLLPAELLEREPYFGNARNLTPSPITSVHLWFDRDVTRAPARGPGGVREPVDLQSPRGRAGGVLPAGRRERVRRAEGRAAARKSNGESWPSCSASFRPLASAKLLRAKVVTEHAATFSAVPGVDRWRPPQASPIANLVVAGDWTATGWPATMEGAVRSGYLAAEAILARAGRPERILRPDLA